MVKNRAIFVTFSFYITAYQFMSQAWLKHHCCLQFMENMCMSKEYAIKMLTCM